MGMIAKLMSLLTVSGDRNYLEAKVDPGGEYNRTGPVLLPPNEDSQPLPGDRVALITTQGKGGIAIIGFLNMSAEIKSAAGEKRIYSRNSENVQVAQVWLKNDGTIELSNDNGSIQLDKSGEINLNGVTIDTEGNIVTPAKVQAKELQAETSIKQGVNEFVGHTHISSSPGSPTGPFPTAPPPP